MTVRDKQSCVFDSLFWVVCQTFGAPEFDSEVSRRNVHCLIERDDIQYKTFLDFLEFGSPGEVCSSFLLATGRHKKNSKTEPNFAGRKSKKDGARN